MLDTVNLVWGRQSGSPAELWSGSKPKGRRSDLAARAGSAEPVHLDVDALHDRLAGADGQLTTKRYGSKEAEYRAGNWQVGDIGVLYRDGRLELRASLPKIVTGGLNDVVLDERGVHHGLRELVSRGSELVEHPLELRDAVPTRLDPVIQWDVPSVAFVIEHLRAAFAPARKLRTENVSPRGGRSLVYGYGTDYVLRFYDKGAEIAERMVDELGHGVPREQLEGLSELERRRAIQAGRQRVREQVWHEGSIDTTLRFEIQSRRRGNLRLIHENGYRAVDVRHELDRTVETLGAVANRDFAGLLDACDPAWPHRVAYTAAALHFAEHEADLAVVRTKVSRRAFYAWRRRSRQVALAVGDWAPVIPFDAFEAGTSLWDNLPAEAAA